MHGVVVAAAAGEKILDEISLRMCVHGCRRRYKVREKKKVLDRQTPSAGLSSYFLGSLMVKV